VTVYGIVAALGAILYGAHHSHEHGGGLHAHGSGGAGASAHSHPDVALLVAAAGLGIVGLTWLLLPDGPRARLPAQLALCSAAAATIHFAVIPPHWDEYVPFVVLFAVSGAFQLLWAAAVLVRPDRAVLLAGAVVNLGVAAAWALSRTVGMLLRTALVGGAPARGSHDPRHGSTGRDRNRDRALRGARSAVVRF
jgi:hypothetical protein